MTQPLRSWLKCSQRSSVCSSVPGGPKLKTWPQREQRQRCGWQSEHSDLRAGCSNRHGGNRERQQGAPVPLTSLPCVGIELDVANTRVTCGPGSGYKASQSQRSLGAKTPENSSDTTSDFAESQAQTILPLDGASFVCGAVVHAGSLLHHAPQSASAPTARLLRY